MAKSSAGNGGRGSASFKDGDLVRLRGQQVEHAPKSFIIVPAPGDHPTREGHSWIMHWSGDQAHFNQIASCALERADVSSSSGTGA